MQQFNADWSGDHGVAPQPVQVVTRAWYNPNLETRWFMIPGMIGTLTLIQTMMLTAMSVAREREQGTFDQLLVTPFRPFEIMAGKALPSMVVGTIQATGVLLVAQLWFRIPFAGSYADALRGLAAVSAGRGGHRPAGLGRGRDHAAGDAVFHAADHAVLAALRADHARSAACRALVQYLTAINPLRYAIDITRRVYLEGAGLGSADLRSVAPGADRRAHPDGGLLDVQPPHAMTAMSSPHRHARSAALSIALMAALLARAPSDRTSCRPTRKRPSIGRRQAPRGSRIRRRTVERADRRARAPGGSVFRDPELSSLIERAVDANLDLRAAVLRVEEARAQRAIAAAAYWPLPVRRRVLQPAALQRDHAHRLAVQFGRQRPAAGRRRHQHPESLQPVSIERRRLLGNRSVRPRTPFGGGRGRRRAGLGRGSTRVVRVRARRCGAKLHGTSRRAGAPARSPRKISATIEELLDLTRQRRAAGLTTHIDVSNATAQAIATRAELPAFELQITAEHQSAEPAARPRARGAAR